MSVFLGAAEALQFAKETVGDAVGEVSIEGEMGGRRYRHWSFWVLAAGATVGAVAAVAAFIFSVQAIAWPSVFIFVTNSIGAYYIRKFDTLRELEDYVDLMAKKIKILSTIILDLKRINQGLSSTADKLEENRHKTEDLFREEEEKINHSAAEFEKIAQKLADTERKLEKIKELYDNLQKGVLEFSKEVGKLEGHGQQFELKLKEMAETIGSSMRVLEGLDAEDKEFDELNAVYNRLNEANLKFLSEFQGELGKVLGLFEEAENIRAILESRSEQLARISHEFGSHLDRLEKLEKKESGLSKDAATVGKTTEVLTKLIETLAAENDVS
ncbi:hypothetical protein [Estrella lausannensis]|uniref:Putative membrane protein n=1 Tax=Estrella lausannensis TaxID=483423 RepID=A0A0H5E6C3_9BACT|nr:hypothetical protein [Estrella lausannensis]CRX38825.1 putative membrane protein [Estrella lausannensis]